MLFLVEKHKTKEKATYEKPEISILLLPCNDIVTASHFDPNQGEWDSGI